MASRFAGLLNLRNRSPAAGARWARSCWAFRRGAACPPGRRKHFFNERRARRTREEVLAAARPVVLFVDTFNGFFESANARAALEVLQAAGYTVHVAAKAKPDGKHLCCGRTYLASGMVDEAKAKARRSAGRRCCPSRNSGIPIVGLEPSCLLTLRDEMLSMGLGAPAQAVAAQALLLEEFLAREAQAGRLEACAASCARWTSAVLVHGHCHQKAFGAVSPVARSAQADSRRAAAS